VRVLYFRIFMCSVSSMDPRGLIINRMMNEMTNENYATIALELLNAAAAESNSCPVTQARRDRVTGPLSSQTNKDSRKTESRGQNKG